MAKQSVNIGTTANDNTGDPLRTAFNKLNSNHDEIYAAGPVGTNLQVASNTISSTNSNGNIALDPAGTGSIVLSGPTTQSGVLTLSSTVTGNILPTANNSQTLGSGTAQYSEVHGTVLHVGSLILREVSNTLEIFRADDSTNAILNANSTTSGSTLANGTSQVRVNASGTIQIFSATSDASLATTISTSSMTTPAITVAGNVTGGNLVTAGTITDGALISSDGTVTGAVAITASGAITGGSLTDGTATISSGAIAGATTITGSGAITGGSLTDGTATISSGAISGATTIAASSTITASGNITGGNIVTGGQLAATGNIAGGNLTTTKVTYSGDSTVQSVAYTPHLIRLTSDGSAISSTQTDAVGGKFALSAGRMYEVDATLIMTNSSTGNISVGILDSATQISSMNILNTIMINGGVFQGTQSRIVAGAIDSGINTAATFAMTFSGFVNVSGATNFSIQISTSSGTLTPKAGSFIRLNEYVGTTIGSTV